MLNKFRAILRYARFQNSFTEKRGYTMEPYFELPSSLPEDISYGPFLNLFVVSRNFMGNREGKRYKFWSSYKIRYEYIIKKWRHSRNYILFIPTATPKKTYCHILYKMRLEFACCTLFSWFVSFYPDGAVKKDIFSSFYMASEWNSP